MASMPPGGPNHHPDDDNQLEYAQTELPQLPDDIDVPTPANEPSLDSR